MRRKIFTDEEWKAIMKTARNFQFATKSINSTNEENQNMKGQFSMCARHSESHSGAVRDAESTSTMELTYKTKLDKIYRGLFHMVSDKLEDCADMLAKDLVTDPHTSFDTHGRGTLVTVETEIFLDIAAGKDFVELLAKVADLRKEIASLDPCEEILYIKRTKPNENDKECVSIMLGEKWGDRFATLINAIESIDKYIENVGDDKGMSCERVCPCGCKAQFDVSLSKRDIARVKVDLIYALSKVRYELNDQAKQRIIDAVDAEERKADPQQ